MVELDGERPAGEVPRDDDWGRVVVVRLCPRATLSAGQRRVIEADYGMVEGETRLEVRTALLFLFLRRLGLDREDGMVELAKRDEVIEVLTEVMKHFKSDS
ncbi:hypothetical protein [Falsiroseomonas sp.]|uniref:hypothetical protein n=1 Tax=Falsiroseomonas sp. TaxID=2870721 RepID=UPI0035668540